MCYYHHACFLVCLSLLSVIETSMDEEEYRATLEFKSSECIVSNNLIYDSSLSLSVSVKVTPKSSGACLNST